MSSSAELNPKAIENALFALLKKRASGKTICPSEVARSLDNENWRTLMDSVHATATTLAEQGNIEITQKGQSIHPRQRRGPYRIRIASIKEI